MSPSKTAKKVAFNCQEQVATMLEEEEPGNEEGEEDISPTVESSSSSSSLSSSAASNSTSIRRELLRLESLVRCHVQHQWHLSIENYRCVLFVFFLFKEKNPWKWATERKWRGWIDWLPHITCSPLKANWFEMYFVRVWVITMFVNDMLTFFLFMCRVVFLPFFLFYFIFFSKLRKRQSSALSTPDAEVASTSPSSDCSACPHSGDPGSAASIAQFNKEVQVRFFVCLFVLLFLSNILILASFPVSKT